MKNDFELPVVNIFLKDICQSCFEQHWYKIWTHLSWHHVWDPFLKGGKCSVNSPSPNRRGRATRALYPRSKSYSPVLSHCSFWWPANILASRSLHLLPCLPRRYMPGPTCVPCRTIADCSALPTLGYPNSTVQDTQNISTEYRLAILFCIPLQLWVWLRFNNLFFSVLYL